MKTTRGPGPKRRAVRELLREVDKLRASIRVPYPSEQFDEAAYARIVAVAGLARCARLLLANERLSQVGLEDVASLPLRPLAEVWLMSIELLYEPVPALRRWQDAHVLQLSFFSDLSPDVAEYVQAVQDIRDADPGTKDTSDKVRRIRWEQVTERVGQLLESNGHSLTADQFKELIYDTMYRNESMTSIHGGIATVEGHLAADSARREAFVRGVRQTILNAETSLALGGGIVAALALEVSRRFGGPPDAFWHAFQDRFALAASKPTGEPED
ncbi:MAG: hypothetical protein AB7L13_07160 [Acidimicrobiia bacterium]